MRAALVKENSDLVQEDYRYVMQVTGDNAEGKAQLITLWMSILIFPLL